jgi:hypothetical protein
MIETLFTQALGLVAPWQVDQVIFTAGGWTDRLPGEVRRGQSCLSGLWSGGAAAARPLGALLAPSGFLPVRSPSACRGAASGLCRLRQGDADPVPWAREGSRFTLLFEALTLMLAPTMSVLAAGRLLRVRSRRLWRVIEHHVARRAPRKVMPRFARSALMRPPVSAARRTSLFSMILMRHVCCLPRRVGIRPRWGSSPATSPSMAANRARLPMSAWT